MLLDEVAAHLDDSKREALLERISALHLQAWITTTNPEQFESIRPQAQFLEIKNNQATLS
jgi:DNA replication and repair protein RecF